MSCLIVVSEASLKPVLYAENNYGSTEKPGYLLKLPSSSSSSSSSSSTILSNNLAKTLVTFCRF
uniref:Uncharacterized protein n=1 Tax=Anguilla anguilla TaxID=7936 RepID=A0A0E9UV13_ANGAN